MTPTPTPVQRLRDTLDKVEGWYSNDDIRTIIRFAQKVLEEHRKAHSLDTVTIRQAIHAAASRALEPHGTTKAPDTEGERE